jgi:lysophospholipase L1-like esterase
LKRFRIADALLVVVTLLLLVPLAEVVVRIAAPQTLPSQEFIRGFVLRDMYVADEKAGFRVAPNFQGRIDRGGVVTEFSTNSLGLRGPELAPKAPGERRILALGDSFTWGWGVPQGEEWVAIMERTIDERLGRDAVVAVNGGVNAYGTENELALLERIGRDVAPDLVLVGFFANDFTDNLFGATGVYTVKDGYLYDHFTQDYFREHWLARESHLYRLIVRGVQAARTKWFGALPSTRPIKQFTEAEFEEGMRLSERHLLRMRDLCTELGARFAVVWLPADVYALPRHPPDIPLQRELESRIAAAGIPSIDLMPVVRGEPNVTGLYIKNDGHFTVRGNRVAGRAVAKWILDSGLLESSSATPSLAVP